jgi:hypothetical protein
MPQTVDGVELWWRKLDIFCYRIGFRNYENSILIGWKICQMLLFGGRVSDYGRTFWALRLRQFIQTPSTSDGVAEAERSDLQ